MLPAAQAGWQQPLLPAGLQDGLPGLVAWSCAAAQASRPGALAAPQLAARVQRPQQGLWLALQASAGQQPPGSLPSPAASVPARRWSGFWLSSCARRKVPSALAYLGLLGLIHAWREAVQGGWRELEVHQAGVEVKEVLAFIQLHLHVTYA